jgi:hypothetical protein
VISAIFARIARPARPLRCRCRRRMRPR